MPENALLVYKLLYRAVTPLKRFMGLCALMLLAAFNALQGATDKGIQLYEAENYPKAKAWYEKQLPSPTHRPYAQYNLGCIAYQEQDYAKAQEAFEAALHTPSPDLQEKAFYNLGNTAFQQASQASTNVQEAIQYLEKAIQAYTNSLDLNANNPKAKANCELAQKELERLKDQAKEKDEAQSKAPPPPHPPKPKAEETNKKK